ncbi:cation-dependent mannose-6-phosphate receptor [Elysia marginata]|uniref:Cation-dependent mannose-6-phosphate receptor n=1 Tax=Elysia marginata TaxID=1093978 RepID=A0AAV4J6P2_9GAST|nr:cation-dependent mannose-6-phosphate receptor [Elysia marginata]
MAIKRKADGKTCFALESRSCFFFLCLIHLSYSQITPAPLLCSVSGFDYFNLTAAVWSVNLNQSCLSPRPSQVRSSNISSCSLLIAFCQNLDWLEACEHSSVCQRSATANYSLGAYSYNPFTTDGGLQAKFANGDPYQSASQTPCQLKTQVNLACHHKAKWLVKGSTETVKPAPWLRYAKFNAENCEMVMEFYYAGACRYSSRRKTIGPGTIVILVFSISFVLYLVVGSLLNLSRGHSGVEILPHHSFWLILPTYIKEGFMFTFCRSRGRSSSNYSAI